MGSPKALVELEGTPLWRRQASLLQGLKPAQLMISAGGDWKVGPGPWTVVRDRVPGLGPLGGIDAALRASSCEMLLVLAVDMPAMSAEFLGELVRSAGPRGVVPEDKGLFQALAAVYPRSILPLLEEVMGGEDLSLQSLVHEAVRSGLVSRRPIADHEVPLFRNVNWPADL
jgi:molybdopterin-guanine dinucleotide biosynthesis protein A